MLSQKHSLSANGINGDQTRFNVPVCRHVQTQTQTVPLFAGVETRAAFTCFAEMSISLAPTERRPDVEAWVSKTGAIRATPPAPCAPCAAARDLCRVYEDMHCWLVADGVKGLGFSRPEVPNEVCVLLPCWPSCSTQVQPASVVHTALPHCLRCCHVACAILLLLCRHAFLG